MAFRALEMASSAGDWARTEVVSRSSVINVLIFAFFRPFGAGVVCWLAQSLRRGLQSVAAARLRYERWPRSLPSRPYAFTARGRCHWADRCSLPGRDRCGGCRVRYWQALDTETN